MINYSIIIPHKNISQLLERCLRSIPSREDLEIIVVDDNSSHEEIANIKHFQSQPDIPDFLLLLTSEGKGAGFARNRGVERAKGKWVVFADADDYFSLDFNTTLEKYKESLEDVIYFKTQCRMTDKPSIVGSRQALCDGWSIMIERINNGEDVIDELLTSMVVPWGKFVKRQFLADNKIEFEEIPFANDVMWSTQIAVHVSPENFASSSIILYTLTERSSSLFNTKNSETFLFRLRVYLRQQKLLRKYGKDMVLNYVYYFSEAEKISVVALFRTMLLALRCNKSIPPVYQIEKKLSFRYPIFYMIVLLLQSIKKRTLEVFNGK